MTHGEIVLRLIDIQVGMRPPEKSTLDQSLRELDAIDPEMKHSMRFHRAARFVAQLVEDERRKTANRCLELRPSVTAAEQSGGLELLNEWSVKINREFELSGTPPASGERA